MNKTIQEGNDQEKAHSEKKILTPIPVAGKPKWTIWYLYLENIS